jgi:hypothetical protein
MFGANSYELHLATEDHADALRRLAELDSRAPLAGRVLIGEIAGSPAAALSLGDDRVIADPFRRTDHLVARLRIRAAEIRAYEATPSLSERMRAVLRSSGRGDRSGNARLPGIQTTPTPLRPQPRLRWTHQPSGAGLRAGWAPSG